MYFCCLPLATHEALPRVAVEIPVDGVTAEQPLLDFHQRGGIFYPLIQVKLMEEEVSGVRRRLEAPEDVEDGAGLPWLRHLPGSGSVLLWHS